MEETGRQARWMRTAHLLLLAGLGIALMIPAAVSARAQAAPSPTGEPTISGAPVVGNTAHLVERIIQRHRAVQLHLPAGYGARRAGAEVTAKAAQRFLVRRSSVTSSGRQTSATVYAYA